MMYSNKLIARGKKMNNLQYITVVFFCFISFAVNAQFTETKEITKRFKAEKDSRIEITNKYGKIELNTWEKDSVIFEISIRVEERNLSKLEKSMAQIDFDFTDSQHYLIARTRIGENMSALEKEFLRFKETILQSDGSMQIDYTVWLPATHNLKIENKFGDIFIGDYTGDAEIDLSNGNLKSHDFEGRLDLTLNFADATINQLVAGRLDCNYSNIYIKKAENLRIVSKSSTFEIQDLNDLDTDSRRDKFRIAKADFISAKGSFSNFRMNELTDRATIRAEYGDIDIRKTAVDFSNILIESKSTDINIYFNRQSNFAFEITHSKADIKLSNEMKIDEEKVLDEKQNKIELKGIFGKEKGHPPKVFINATSGEVNLFAE